MKQRANTNDYMRFVMFDAIKAANEMKQAGMAADIANAVAHAIFESNKTIDTSHLATREDLANLKDDLSAVRDELSKDILKVKDELSKEISGIRTAVSDIKYDIIKWVVPLFLTSIGITITLFFKH